MVCSINIECKDVGRAFRMINKVKTASFVHDYNGRITKETPN